MAFSNIFCPECRCSKKVYRKRHSGIRYAPFRDNTGVAIGELRYYQLHCHACEAMFYLQEQRLYGVTDNKLQQLIVQPEEFEKASLHKPGTIQIGSTVSQYTLMIATGANCSYALNHLTQ